MKRVAHPTVLRLLLAVDGSDHSSRCLDHLLTTQDWYRHPLEVHLLNVQTPLRGMIPKFVPKKQLREFHDEQAQRILQPAKRKLEGAGIRTHAAFVLGDPAEEIVRYASAKKCREVLMGTRGLGGVSGLLLGAVATRVLHLTTVPVLLIK